MVADIYLYGYFLFSKMLKLMESWLYLLDNRELFKDRLILLGFKYFNAYVTNGELEYTI